MIQRRNALTGIAFIPITTLLANCGGGGDGTGTDNGSGQTGNKTIGAFTSDMKGSIHFLDDTWCPHRSLTVNFSGGIIKIENRYQIKVQFDQFFTASCHNYESNHNVSFYGTVIDNTLVFKYKDDAKDYTLNFDLAGNGSGIYNYYYTADGKRSLGKASGPIKTFNWVWA